MASFNGSKYVREQLESFSAQSVVPDEVVICDDGSTDDTVEVISDFMKGAPFKVSLIINENNLGHVQNFAKAMSLCSGDIVFLSDQDDVWFPGKVESVVEVFQQHPNCWVVVHDGDITDARLQLSGQTKMSQIRGGYASVEKVSTGALTAVRTNFLSFALPIPSGISAHDTWLHQLASLFPDRRIIVEKTLQYIRRHDDNTSTWIVNSTSKLNRVDVIRYQAKTKPASDYTDRLTINIGLTSVVNRICRELADQSNLDMLTRVKAGLASERAAIVCRQNLVAHRSFKRKFYACIMLLRGQYSYFNGLRSFARDLTR